MAKKQCHVSCQSVRQMLVENYYEPEYGATSYLLRNIQLHAVTEGPVL